MSISSERVANLGFLLNQIGRLFAKVFENEADHLGTTLAEARVLMHLERNRGCSQAQLAEQTGLEPMTLVRILDRMEADDWIERRPHLTDRRIRELHLGKGALPALQRIHIVAAEVRGYAFDGFAVDDLSTLLALLEQVRERLLRRTAEQRGSTSTTRVARSVRNDMSGQRSSATLPSVVPRSAKRRVSPLKSNNRRKRS